MQIEKLERGDIGILQASGRIDAATAGDFEKRLRGFVDEGKMRVWLLDLAGVTLLSSGALRVLLSLAKRVKGGGPSVALCAPSDSVREVFDISNFSAIFPIHDSVAEGLIHHGAATPTPPAPQESGPARLELVLDGEAHPCGDGDILGSAGSVAASRLAADESVETRHAMVGRHEDRWFLLVPKNVKGAVEIDGAAVAPGSRQTLPGPEHALRLGRLEAILRVSGGGPASGAS